MRDTNPRYGRLFSRALDVAGILTEKANDTAGGRRTGHRTSRPDPGYSSRPAGADLPAALHPPGTLLVETRACRRVQCQPHARSARALQRLGRYEGLVETPAGLAPIVTGVDFPRVPGTSMRSGFVLSEMIGDFSAPGDAPRALERIEGVLSRTQALKGSRDFEEFWAINHELHFAINGLITNSALRQVHDRALFPGLACLVQLRRSDVGRRGSLSSGGTERALPCASGGKGDMPGARLRSAQLSCSPSAFRASSPARIYDCG